LSCSRCGQPAGASVDPTSGVFSWPPSEAQGPDTYTFTVQVSDGATTDTQLITLTVTEVNLAPVLAGVPASATIDETVPYSFTATATDADLPPGSPPFSLTGPPPRAPL